MDDKNTIAMICGAIITTGGAAWIIQSNVGIQKDVHKIDAEVDDHRKFVLVNYHTKADVNKKFENVFRGQEEIKTMIRDIDARYDRLRNKQ